MHETLVMAVLWKTFGPLLAKLRRLGAAGERRRRGASARNHHRYCIEIADADLALMPGCGIAFRLRGELRLLQFGIGRHAALAIVAGQVEHCQIEAMEAGQS